MGGIVFIAGFVCLITSFFCFDYLLKYQFDNYNELWIEDGKPIFFGGRPKSFFYYSFSSQIAGWACLLSLVFGNSDWIKESKCLRRIALIYRIGIISFWILWFFQIILIFNR
jgi:hypothetical protein